MQVNDYMLGNIDKCNYGAIFQLVFVCLATLIHLVNFVGHLYLGCCNKKLH